MIKKIILLVLLFSSLCYGEEIPYREIKGLEVWKGEVVIDGIVAVRKGGKLKILPGTHIAFVVKDYDGDGIGDGELNVEGQIECIGTKDAPIVFTAMTDKVEPSSWKYVMVNHAEKADFEWTIFEGAFSGLQIHFTNAKVNFCVFRKNIDGLRFSTVNIKVFNCMMIENKHGIRYEERDSTGIVCGCTITNNEIGIFPVTHCKGKLLFKFNNIYENEYNVKIGDEQKENLSFAYNYFGSRSYKDVRKTIYDKYYDKNLPTVKFKPFLKQKVKRGESLCSKDF